MIQSCSRLYYVILFIIIVYNHITSHYYTSHHITTHYRTHYTRYPQSKWYVYLTTTINPIIHMTTMTTTRIWPRTVIMLMLVRSACFARQPRVLPLVNALQQGLVTSGYVISHSLPYYEYVQYCTILQLAMLLNSKQIFMQNNLLSLY